MRHLQWCALSKAWDSQVPHAIHNYHEHFAGHGSKRARGACVCVWGGGGFCWVGSWLATTCLNQKPLMHACPYPRIWIEAWSSW